MVQVIWTEPALEQLREVHDFIARDSPRAAQRQVERIQTVVQRLALFPLSGRHLPEFPRSHFREIIEGNYRIIYRYDSAHESVFIISIYHGRRRLASLPED